MKRQNGFWRLMILASLAVLFGRQSYAGLSRIDFVKTNYLVGEEAGQAILSIQRGGDTTRTAEVDYATSDGTARAGLDYIAQSGTVRFEALEQRKTVMIPILIDPLMEGPETILVRLSNPSSAAVLEENRTAIITIRDSNQSSQFVPDSLFVNENGGAATVTLQRSGDLSRAITLDYWTSDGTAVAGKDYVAQKGTVMLAPNVATQSISIPIFDNGVVDGLRTINIVVSNSMVFPVPSTAVLTIRDNEQSVLLDPTFFPPQIADGCISALALQSDGKILIGGCFTNLDGFSRIGVARLNQDGRIDPSFDPGSGASGATQDYYGGSGIFSLAVQPDSKILVGGAFLRMNGRLHPSLARLNADGTLDDNFSVDLKSTTGDHAVVQRIIVQGDGKILVGGPSVSGSGVARLNSDGSIDAGFHLSNLGLVYPFSAFALQEDGKIIVGGQSFDASAGVRNLIRLNANGALDSTFTVASLPTLGGSFTVSALAVQADGKILAGLDFYSSASQPRYLIARLNTDGSIDSSFNDPMRQQNFGVSQILVLANGQILAVGDSGGMRFNADGSLDRLFATEYIYAAAIQPDGLIVAGGVLGVGGLGRIFPDAGRHGGPEFIAKTFVVSETNSAAQLTLRRLGDSSREMTVDFTTRDGSAREGSDYIAQHGTIHFAALQVTNTISIPIINDSRVEKDNSFEVILANPSAGSSLQSIRAATVVIASDDTGIQFASDTFSVNESDGFAEIVVTRDGSDPAAATVNYETSDGTAGAGTDYLGRSGTINFAYGETNQTIRIPILDDGWVEGDETVRLALSSPQGDGLLGSRAEASLLIIDNERNASNRPPTISFAKPDFVASEHSGLALVTLQRSGDTSQPASVQYATEDGSALGGLDYLPASGTVEFAALQTEITIAVMLLDDGIPGADTSFSVTLRGPSQGTRIDAEASTTTVTIADSQRPGSVDFTFRPLFETAPETTGAGLLSVNGYRIALQPDGKLIVAGNFRRVNGVARSGICRLNPDGSLDESFDSRNALLPGPSDFENFPLISIYSLALQPDGKILLRGHFLSAFGPNYANFIRLNNDGSVDGSFVPDKATQVISVYGHGAAMAVQPDGKILVAEDEPCCSSEPARLARLEPDGSADPSFVTLEVVGVDGGWGSTFRCIVIDGDGRALFEGNTDSLDPYIGGPQRGLTRLNASGHVDESFHPVMDRTVAVDWGSRTTALVQQDGKIVTAGLFSKVNEVDRSGLARLNSDGSTDGSFAPEPRDNGYYANALALQPDGKIIAGLSDGSIVRLNANGAEDPTFNFRGIQEDGVFTAFSDLLVQPDGQILFAAVLDDLNTKDGRVQSSIVRLNGDKHLATDRPRFRSIRRAKNGEVRLQWSVFPGKTYSIETSVDLNRWNLMAKQAAVNYLLEVTDTTSEAAHRFYRIVEALP